ncbi:hypothetical protein GCM10027073_53620 [Streptomyces chlorus]
MTVLDADTGARLTQIPIGSHPAGLGHRPGLRRFPAGNPADDTVTAIDADHLEVTELDYLVQEFAELLTPAADNDTKLTEWITAVRTSGLPRLHAFANGLELDRTAVDAGLPLPHHNDPTEGVGTRTERIMRQMHGRAGFPLLRHRILLQ